MAEALFKILVVDDDLICRKMLEHTIKEMELEVVAAGSASEAIKCAQAQAFDLILTDIGMPNMNGVELAAHLRQKLSITSPIIAITGHATREDSALYKKAGIDKLIEKPFTPEVFKEVLQTYTTVRPHQKPN